MKRKMKKTIKKSSIIVIVLSAALLGMAALLDLPKLLRRMLKRPKKEPKLPGKRTIACIGDSITFGSGVVWTRKRDAWPYVLDRLLGEEYQVVNYGISGATMQKVSDKPYRPDFFQAVETMETKAIILMLGTNDTKPYNWNPKDFEESYAERIERLKNCTKKLFVMAPPWTFVLPGQTDVVCDIQKQVLTEEIYPTVLRLAKEHDVQVIDLYPLTEGHTEYFGDGLHPNKQGNRVIAEYICGQIREEI